MTMKLNVVCVAFLGTFVSQGASLKWTADQGGDLMAKENWDTATVVPAAGDKLTIDRGSTTPVPGVFTFSVSETPTFSTVAFGHACNQPRSLDPGKGKTLRTVTFTVAYDLLSILSGSYYVTTQFWPGNSTSSSDNTFLTINGEDTYVNTAQLNVGRGSTTVSQSRAHVTVSGKATFDAADVQIGQSGGWKNSLVVTDAGTRFYATNTSFKIGATRVARNSGGCFYSTDNTVTVSNGASFAAAEIDVGSKINGDITTANNVFTVMDGATASADSIYVLGTNSVYVKDDGWLTATDVWVGYSVWSSYEDSKRSGGSHMTIANGGRVESSTVRIGTNASNYPTRGNKLTVSAGGLMEAETLYVGLSGNPTEDCVLAVENGGVVTNGSFYVGGTNKAVIAGTVVVTNVARLGTSGNYVGHSELVVKDGGLLRINNADSFLLGHGGYDNVLTVSGAGSRLEHNALTIYRKFLVGAAGGRNRLTVSNGGCLSTTASMVIGHASSDATTEVNCGTLQIATDLEVGTTGYANALLKVVGSTARVAVGGDLKVGANGRIVFDLADAAASSAALVQLAHAPQFAAGATIYVTSSNPEITKAEKFDCKLLSCAVDMDLSDVTIQVDPASDLRRVRKGDAKLLCFRGGRRSGLSLVFR